MSGEILRVDPRLYGAGTRFLITVMATAPDGRTNSTSFDFMGTGPDGTPPSNILCIVLKRMQFY